MLVKINQMLSRLVLLVHCLFLPSCSLAKRKSATCCAFQPNTELLLGSAYSPLPRPPLLVDWALIICQPDTALPALLLLVPLPCSAAIELATAQECSSALHARLSFFPFVCCQLLCHALFSTQIIPCPKC